MIRSRHRSGRYAFSIVETVFSILLVGGVMVAALNSVEPPPPGDVSRRGGHAASSWPKA
jgi:hypothetical protein